MTPRLIFHTLCCLLLLGRVAHPSQVLILGGGDGLAAREVLRDPRVRHVTLVDLDPEMTHLFRDTPQLAALNKGSLSSPLIAPRSYWTVASTLEAAGLLSRGYHAYVPSFGEWGFTLAAHRPISDAVRLPNGLRFLTASSERAMFDFPPDMARRPTPVNRLDNQALVRSFAEEWGKYEG